jgi:hypothetical protein
VWLGGFASAGAGDGIAHERVADERAADERAADEYAADEREARTCASNGIGDTGRERRSCC